MSTQRVIWLYSKTRRGHSHDVSKMEPQISTRGKMGAIFTFIQSQQFSIAFWS